MSGWDAYPPDYRSREVQAVVSAALAGECVSVVGLSGAGKSNLLGFLANRVGTGAAETAVDRPCRFVFVDCNRLPEIKELLAHPTVARRVEEFWADHPPPSRSASLAWKASRS